MPTHIALLFSNRRQNPNRVSNLDFGCPGILSCNFQMDVKIQTNRVSDFDFGRPRLSCCYFQTYVKIQTALAIWILDAHAYRIAIFKQTSKSKPCLQFGLWMPTHISNRRQNLYSSLKNGFWTPTHLFKMNVKVHIQNFRKLESFTNMINYYSTSRNPER